MSRLNFNGLLKFLTISLLTPVLLLTTMSCFPANESALIESLIKSTEGGEMIFVTEDGETIKVTFTKVSSASGDSNKVEDIKNEEEEKKPDKDCDDSTKLADILPKLDSIEDVFRLLGVWEKADIMYDEGYSWSQIAGELDYDKEKMYAQLQVIIEERLHQARELDLINQEQFEYKFKYFSERALKWVNKIFADSEKNNSEELADILPKLDSIEDVFRTLGLWADAELMRNEGLTWSHIAEEFNYDKDTMYAHLKEIIEERLHHAKKQGLITYEQYKHKVEYYNEKALKWVNEIFAE